MAKKVAKKMTVLIVAKYDEMDGRESYIGFAAAKNCFVRPLRAGSPCTWALSTMAVGHTYELNYTRKRNNYSGFEEEIFVKDAPHCVGNDEDVREVFEQKAQDNIADMLGDLICEDHECVRLEFVGDSVFVFRAPVSLWLGGHKQNLELVDCPEKVNVLHK